MQVTRRRRRAEKGRSGLLGRHTGRRIPLVTAGTTVLALVATGAAFAQTHEFGTDQVGQITDRGQVVSSDQYLAPYGDRLVIDNGKIMSSSVSPDGTHLAASLTDGGSALAIVDVKNFKVQQLVSAAASSSPRLSGNSVGQEGPTYSPDGSQLWLGQTDGYTRLTVNPDGGVTGPVFVPIPADGPKHALVGAAVFSPDGSTVYSAVNGQNRVVAIDAATGSLRQSWSVGNARVTWSRSAPSSTSATRAGARRGPATPRSTPTAPRCRPTRSPRPPPPAPSASSTWRTRTPPS